MRQHELVRRLRRFLPERAVLWHEEDTRVYECDGLTAYRQVPMVVAVPESAEQVQRILQVCADADVPVVPRGAGTGLSGGALPRSDGLLLSMAKLTRVLRLDPYARVAIVEPGVRNITISEMAAPSGLFYAPDPSSQLACTIGGNVAENSGGVHCLKYGLTLHNVLRLRGFTIHGDPLDIGSLGPDAPGYDLLALAIGSEGMLMVVTEVSVRLLPKPPCARVVMASFDDLPAAADAAASIVAEGIVAAGLEMMDKATIRAVDEFSTGILDSRAAAVLLCESDGTADEVEEEVQRIKAVLFRARAKKVTVSSDERDRLRLWSARKAAFAALGRISPDLYCLDGTIPRARLAEVLRFISSLEGKYGLRCANVFHAGDGNLHPLILFDANKPGELRRTERFVAEILEKCVEVGGTITGEHGVGVEKLDQMCVQFTGKELAAFQAVKKAFDSTGLLNPAKVIPTTARCAEYGRMHIRGSRLPHPEMPRF